MAKHKPYYLIGGFIIALILCYHLAFKNTFFLKDEFDTLNQQNLQALNYQEKLTDVGRKERFYDSIMKSFRGFEKYGQIDLAGFISQSGISKDIKVMDFSEPHELRNDEALVRTFDITLEGNYSDLAKTLFEMETMHNFGKLVHIKFETKEDFKTNQTFLQVRLLVEQTIHL